MINHILIMSSAGAQIFNIYNFGRDTSFLSHNTPLSPLIIRRNLNDIYKSRLCLISDFPTKDLVKGIAKNSLSSTTSSKLKCLLSENDSVPVPSSVACKAKKKSIGILGVTSWLGVANIHWTKDIILTSPLIVMALRRRMREKVWKLLGCTLQVQQFHGWFIALKYKHELMISSLNTSHVTKAKLIWLLPNSSASSTWVSSPLYFNTSFI